MPSGGRLCRPPDRRAGADRRAGRGLLHQGVRRRLPRRAAQRPRGSARTSARAGDARPDGRARRGVRGCVGLGRSRSPAGAVRSGARVLAPVADIAVRHDRRGASALALVTVAVGCCWRSCGRPRCCCAPALARAPDRRQGGHVGLRLRRSHAANAVHRVVVRRSRSLTLFRLLLAHPQARMRAARGPVPGAGASLAPRRPTCFERAVLPAGVRGGSAIWRPRLRWLQQGRDPALRALHRADPAGAPGLEAGWSGRCDLGSIIYTCCWPCCSAPLLLGVINRIKAVFAGRRGQPLLQTYYDLAKLLRQRARSTAARTTWVFRAGRSSGWPRRAAWRSCWFRWAASPALLAFPGDLVLFAYLLGLMRFFTVAGRPGHRIAFRGHGRQPRGAVLRAGRAGAAAGPGGAGRPTRAACRCRGMLRRARRRRRWRRPGRRCSCWSRPRFVVVFLAENARIPVDDPNTHLELTMIHEVMVLDHGGPDLAFIQYGAALKLWVLGALLVGRRRCRRMTGWWPLRLAAGCGVVLSWPSPDSAWSNRPWPGCGWCACRSSWWRPRCSRSLALVLVLR